MNRYPCSGCGKRPCDGRCFSECPADYAADEEGDTGITLAELRAMYGNPLRDGELGLTETRGDPFKKRAA